MKRKSAASKFEAALTSLTLGLLSMSAGQITYNGADAAEDWRVPNAVVASGYHHCDAPGDRQQHGSNVDPGTYHCVDHFFHNFLR